MPREGTVQMTGIRVEPADGPPETLLPGGSRVSDEETAETLLELAIMKIRVSNRAAPARPKSHAITQCQDALLWLNAYAEGKIR